MEIERTKELQFLARRFREAPVVAIVGPRQCGKTTLARQWARKSRFRPIHRFDLENPRDLAQFENPLLALESLKGLIVIDEIQRRPELFPILRVLVDKNREAKYLILGSASGSLLAQSSESLAGRIAYLELGGLSLDSLPKPSDQKLWIRGGFPRSFLSKNDQASFAWRQDFITTFLERDVPALGIRVPAGTLRRFWIMLAHYHGQIFNASEIARSLGASETAARHYLDILCGTFLIRQLQPWFYNTKKRLLRRPKIYFRDSGLFHALISAQNRADLLVHPKLGASWEGFSIEQAIQHLSLRQEEVFYWGVHTGGELDLVFQRNGKLWGVEAKYGDAPTLTQSMKAAIDELELAHLWVVYPGETEYALDKRVSVVPLNRIGSAIP
ncbi:MAG: ATP-binding protein [Candidatus Omnitrophica bacterium]|nr:ATP-binding protein [Candidatus Omnitrophota bacterium]